jgi:hypothetical protein
MKPKLRDYLTILFALLVIFLCGSGVGFLVGEKKGRQESAPPNIIRSSDDNNDWEKTTLNRLANRLDLQEGTQTKAIRAEVHETAEEIRNSREKALQDHYQALLKLHDRILPHLEPDQQEMIKKDRKSLQHTIDLRFQSSAAE